MTFNDFFNSTNSSTTATTFCLLRAERVVLRRPLKMWAVVLIKIIAVQDLTKRDLVTHTFPKKSPYYCWKVQTLQRRNIDYLFMGCFDSGDITFVVIKTMEQSALLVLTTCCFLDGKTIFLPRH